MITEVQNSIKQVRLHQSATRMNVMKDWYMVTGNNSYVMYWSLFQIACVLMTSSFQVYFVRKLFNIPNVTPTAKPRAWIKIKNVISFSFIDKYDLCWKQIALIRGTKQNTCKFSSIHIYRCYQIIFIHVYSSIFYIHNLHTN